jgi:lantibiotic modifying enzyme
VLRSTMLYGELQELLLVAPPQQRAWAINAARELLATKFPHVSWRDAQVAAEMAALERGDIPYFSVMASSRTLETTDSLMNDAFEVSGFDALFERANRLGYDDLHNQLWLTDAFLRTPGTVESSQV